MALKTMSLRPSLKAHVAVISSDIGYIKRNVGELKSDVKELRRDDRTGFRMLFGAIIIVALGLAGSWPKGSVGCER